MCIYIYIYICMYTYFCTSLGAGPDRRSYSPRTVVRDRERDRERERRTHKAVIMPAYAAAHGYRILCYAML